MFIRSVLALTLLATLTAAQGHRGGSWIWSVYVDPQYGDDRLAMELNPSTNTTQAPVSPLERRPLADYPATQVSPDWFPDKVNGNNGHGYLQHAPYTFRTLTGPNGALEYVRRNFGFVSWGSTVPQPMGWTNSNGVDPERRVGHVVIHCLPGLYGPRGLAGEPDVDPQSGLRFNGEVFPILLPGGVSLQGTSALDTIFDARGEATAIIRTGNWTGQDPDYFIDSLTLRNAQSDGGEPWTLTPAFARNHTGAAIYVGEQDMTNIPLTISNCFIVDNAVGIAVETDELTIGLRIVNNTLAFNRIGVWCGFRMPDPPPPPNTVWIPNLGHARCVLVNNVIDIRREDTVLRVPLLGVHPDDFTVASAAGGPASPNLVNFNAWDGLTVQMTYPAPPAVGIGSPVSNFPKPGFRGSGGTNYSAVQPRVDLRPVVGAPGDTQTPRGILFVNDALRASGAGDLSPHDFRLAPHVVQDPRTITAQNPILALDPLVSMGIDFGPTSLTGYTNITMVNGEVLTHPPGIDLTVVNQPQDPDVFHAWDWDTEGYGNPRIRRRAGFPAFDPNLGVFGDIDLGADELGELVMAGYLPGTRILGTLPPGENEPFDQIAVYFLDLRVPSPVHPRPSFRIDVGEVYGSWDHVRLQSVAEGSPDCVQVTLNGAVIDTNYTDVTDAAAGSARARLINTAFTTPWDPQTSGHPPITRNLACDFSPSLISDWHPFWGPLWFGTAGSFPAGFEDVYSGNPWFGSRWSVTGIWPQTVQNWHLYDNPLHPNVALFRSDVLVGSLNPPGTLMNPLPSPDTNHGLYTVTPGSGFQSFGPPIIGGSCSGAGTFTIGMFGVGDAWAGGLSLCPDMLPTFTGFEGRGLRYNCQVVVDLTSTSNLQTFLAVTGLQAGLASMSSGRSWRSAGPTIDGAVLRSITRPTASLPANVARSIR
ncbi:MAG: hypothetical protein IPM29_10540 [Planctomycetes bacterium]|nr:hypothetical protein [Planctomycetota bacterium]